jgi:hypothetical protein
VASCQVQHAQRCSNLAAAQTYQASQASDQSAQTSVRTCDRVLPRLQEGCLSTSQASHVTATVSQCMETLWKLQDAADKPECQALSPLLQAEVRKQAVKQRSPTQRGDMLAVHSSEGSSGDHSALGARSRAGNESHLALKSDVARGFTKQTLLCRFGT